jgi:SnoaL-like domain
MDIRELAARLERVESRLEIAQLPIRYAMAVDARDVDTWVSLFVPDVQVGRDSFGHDALRAQIDPLLRTFRRSVHQICGHRVELDDADPDRATGATYCRAEHEVDERWIVMAICYFDDYQRVDGTWRFRRRRERHWYAADIDEHPQSVAFDSWHGGAPSLPDAFPTWQEFWSEPETAESSH